MTRGWKIALWIAAAIVALNLVLAAVRGLTGGTPGGPASSSYSTGSDGAAAYATLLTDAGHVVVHERKTPHAVELTPRDTAVVLDPPFVLANDAAALRTFVRGGGRLVASAGDSDWFGRVVPGAPADDEVGLAHAKPLAPAPEIRGVRSVAGAGENGWRRTRGALPLVGNARTTVLALATPGAGRALLLADASPLQNAYLGRADNAQLALALAGAPTRRVVFFESYHGFGRGSGLSAIPGNWKLALLLAAAAAAVFMVARARRLGPPEDEARPFAPARREYVDAVAATLARTRDPRAALGGLRDELRARIARRTGLQAGASDDELVRAAARLGFNDEEVSALRADAANDELALGRAFARSAEGRRSSWRT